MKPIYCSNALSASLKEKRIISPKNAGIFLFVIVLFLIESCTSNITIVKPEASAFKNRDKLPVSCGLYISPANSGYTVDGSGFVSTPKLKVGEILESFSMESLGRVCNKVSLVRDDYMNKMKDFNVLINLGFDDDSSFEAGTWGKSDLTIVLKAMLYDSQKVKFLTISASNEVTFNTTRQAIIGGPIWDPFGPIHKKYSKMASLCLMKALEDLNDKIISSRESILSRIRK